MNRTVYLKRCFGLYNLLFCALPIVVFGLFVIMMVPDISYCDDAVNIEKCLDGVKMFPYVASAFISISYIVFVFLTPILMRGIYDD